MPADAEADILNGGQFLTGRLGRDDPFWAEMQKNKFVEALGPSGTTERFEAPDSSEKINEFLEACSG